jgi:hypothetical protein
MDRSKQERLWFCVRRKSKRNGCGHEVSPEEMGVTPIMKHATYLPGLNLGPRIALREYEVNDRPCDQQDDCRPVPVRITATCDCDCLSHQISLNNDVGFAATCWSLCRAIKKKEAVLRASLSREPVGRT